MHDLPIGPSLSVVKDIVSMMGAVDESRSKMEGSNFQRFRVEIDISKPMCRGRKITLCNGHE